MPYRDPERQKEAVRECLRKLRDRDPTYYRRYKRKPDTTYKERMKRYKENNPEKVRARSVFAYAVRKGTISRPNNCSKCGAGGNIEGDHADYSKPLEVIWVCKECHYKNTKERLQIMR